MTRVQEPVHAVLVMIPESAFLDYLCGRKALVKIPADATLAAWWRITRGVRDGLPGKCDGIVLRIEHPSFAEVQPGTKIPRVRALFRRRDS